MPRTSRPLSLIAVLTGTAFIVAGLAVPTGAIVSGAADEGQSGTVVLEPTSDHAGISGDELVVEFDGVNERATSSFDGVFAITAQEDEEIRLETDVEGVAFYRGDSGDRIAADDRLELEDGETVPIGMSVETADADPGVGSFTVYVESDPAEPTYAVGSRVFSGRLTALLAVPIAVGFLFVAGVVGRRRDLWPVLP